MSSMVSITDKQTIVFSINCGQGSNHIPLDVLPLVGGMD